MNSVLKKSWRARHKWNLEWDSYLWAETRGKLPKVPLARAKITLVRHAHRMLDFDGMVASFKPVIDALVTVGVLSDDSWKVTGKWECDQSFRKKSAGPLIEIIIEEVRTDAV
jgi:hypothetical protein